MGFRTCVAIVVACLCASTAGAEPVTASFTDSQGRRLLYRYELPGEAHPGAPRGVLVIFHGNNTGTQQDMLPPRLRFAKRLAEPVGLVPVVVASPGTKPGTDIRHWYKADQRLIHELLSTHFGGEFRVDHNRVFLVGYSQGACFLNEFVPRFGVHYGGGLLAHCGCFNYRNALWNPPREFASRFRVFVSATTGDFLHSHSLDAYGYYRYTIGLETRGDLAGEGEHCAAGSVPAADVINWLVHGTGLPDEPEHAHLERVALLDHVAGITVDADGALHIVRQPPGVEARLWRSVDRGKSLYPVSRVPGPVVDLDAVDRALFASVRRLNESEEYYQHEEVVGSLYRSVDGGLTFQAVDLPRELASADAVADRRGRLFVATYGDDSGAEVWATEDLGASWTSLGLSATRWMRLANVDPIATTRPEAYVFVGDAPYINQLEIKRVGTATGGDWVDVSKSPSGGRIWRMAWDGGVFLALADSPDDWRTASLHSSVDRGTSWMDVAPPRNSDPFWTGAGLNALGHRQIFVLPTIQDGHLRGAGGSWTRIHGSGSVRTYEDRLDLDINVWDWDHRVAVDQTTGDVYLTAGRGVFRLDGASRSIVLPDPVDADADGVPDVLDEFPADGSEYIDTDGDGVGNNRDDDDDDDGVPDQEDGVPLDQAEVVDTDRDGVGDNRDDDDDGDGISDVLDAFPLDSAEAADADRDGIGNWEDDDDDNDGVADLEDDFPLYPAEWRDTDGDGIGDNADWDDDNDGRNDLHDPAPTIAGRHIPTFGLEVFGGGWGRPGEKPPSIIPIYVPLDRQRVAGVSYPAAEGRSQSYGQLELGDGHNLPVYFMIDNLGGEAVRVYFDRNGNADLTDDGPPTETFIAADPAVDPRFQRRQIDGKAVVDLAYRSGVVVPYALNLTFVFEADGAISSERSFLYSATQWRGEVPVVGGRNVGVRTGDLDSDGIFTGTRDDYSLSDYVYVCVDRTATSADCATGGELFRHGDTFMLDGREVQILVATSGHRVEIGPRARQVPYMPPASHPEWQGFVQVTNRSDEAGIVEIQAFDDAGQRRGPLALELAPRTTRFFNSDDLENGNPDKGLSGTTGPGEGAWRLELASDLDIDALAYVRTTDGFLTRMHDMAGRDRDGRILVPIFNPASNTNQVSVLRLTNPSTEAASVTVRGYDDDGRLGGPVDLRVPARGAREVTAQELEAGAAGLTGALGDGRGKWRLSVESERPVRAMSLLRSPSGHITNLSTPPYEDGGPLHHVSMFPPAGSSTGQGFARVVNRSGTAGRISVVGYDDAGTRHGPVAFEIKPGATVHFNSDDLQRGNAAKGLAPGFGTGTGAWSLEFESDLELDVLGYVRTTDGFLTSMHEAFHRDEGGIWVPTFNPGSNASQISMLRLVNPADSFREVEVQGVDEAGQSPGRPVRFSIPPRGARTVTALELESGTIAGATGALGDGVGKWQLTVKSDGPLRAMSLLRSRTGHLTNLSTLPERFPSRWMATNEKPAATASRRTRARVPSVEDVHAGTVGPNIIVIQTETAGEIHFDLDTLPGPPS